MARKIPESRAVSAALAAEGRVAVCVDPRVVLVVVTTSVVVVVDVVELVVGATVLDVVEDVVAGWCTSRVPHVTSRAATTKNTATTATRRRRNCRRRAVRDKGAALTGGGVRIRTGVRGFAGPCLTARPRRQSVRSYRCHASTCA